MTVSLESIQDFAKQNNWILPIGDEDDEPPTYPAGLRLVAMISWESTPIFDDMQHFFWLDMLKNQSLIELRKMALNLGLPYRPRKGDHLLELIDYFQEMVG